MSLNPPLRACVTACLLLFAACMDAKAQGANCSVQNKLYRCTYKVSELVDAIWASRDKESPVNYIMITGNASADVDTKQMLNDVDIVLESLLRKSDEAGRREAVSKLLDDLGKKGRTTMIGPFTFTAEIRRDKVVFEGKSKG